MKTLITALLLLILSAPTLSAEFSLYKGLYTTHLYGDNSQLNNDNDVTILKYKNYIIGSMTNSYNNSGRFLGYHSKVGSYKGFELHTGAALVEGYTRKQLGTVNYDEDNANEKVLALMPLISVSYEVVEGVHLQLNNMGLVVVNAGVRVDF